MSIFKRFSVRDLILITSLAALGIAVKPLVNPLTKLISTPLGIPGGSLSGGFYMLWLVLAIALVDKRWTGILFGFLQAVLVLLIGMAGKMGAFSLIAYTVPGLLADLLMFLGLRRNRIMTHLLLCALANLAGSLVTALFFFKNPPLIMAVNASLALASGIVGGWLSYGIFSALKTARIIK